MTNRFDFLEPRGKTVGSEALEGDLRPDPPALSSAADAVRLQELEATNARLLRLVGELLVANQQLRERRCRSVALRVREQGEADGLELG
jgi:hypothetical protein